MNRPNFSVNSVYPVTVIRFPFVIAVIAALMFLKGKNILFVIVILLSKVVPFIKKVWNQGKAPILEADKGYDSEQTHIDVLSYKVFPLIAEKKHQEI